MEDQTVVMMVVIFVLIAAGVMWHAFQEDEKNEWHASGHLRNIDKSNIRSTKLDKNSSVGYVVTILGQAGKVKACHWYENYSDAEARVLKAFSRTLEDHLVISFEADHRVVFNRPAWNHRGRKEGHVVGSASIQVEGHTPVDGQVQLKKRQTTMSNYEMALRDKMTESATLSGVVLTKDQGVELMKEAYKNLNTEFGGDFHLTDKEEEGGPKADAVRVLHNLMTAFKAL